jgi:RNA polymerase sigma factor (sigma-70 family)
VERYLPLVTGVIARHRLRDADADDVNQTVWLRLVEHLDDLREPEALPGWLATTTRYECLRVIRGSQRTLPVDPQGHTTLDRTAQDEPLEQELMRDQRHRALLQGLAQLPRDRRDLLLLLLADPPVAYAEISRRLGIPVGSIGPTRARALDQLRKCPAMRALAEPDTLRLRR